jgi:hypothetical protein
MSDNIEVIFKIEGESADEQWVETIEAKVVGDSLYILQKSPFNAYEVSLFDKVKAEGELNGYPLITEVVEKSGNSTVRLIVLNEITNPLCSLSSGSLSKNWVATYESANSKLIAVNVPPEANYKEVIKLLEGGAKFQFWDFEEADCAQNDH